MPPPDLFAGLIEYLHFVTGILVPAGEVQNKRDELGSLRHFDQRPWVFGSSTNRSSGIEVDNRNVKLRTGEFGNCLIKPGNLLLISVRSSPRSILLNGTVGLCQLPTRLVEFLLC